MLGRLFKPRWQHRDPLVRVHAVDHLDLSRDEDDQVLATLARGDADAMVRAAAAKRLTDINLLGEMVEKDSAAEVREAATHQVERLLAGLVEAGPGLENRVRLIQLTDNHRALSFIAAESPDTACRLAAVERLEDPDQLLHLALEGADEPLRTAAAERIGSRDHLKRLIHEGRDKRVQRNARENLKRLQQQAARRAELDEEVAQLQSQLEKHAAQAPDRLYAARLQQLEHHWYKLHDSADETATRRIEALLEDCHRRQEEWRHQQEEEVQRDRAGEEHRATVDTLERLLAETTPETWDQGAGSLRALLATQERRWQNAADFLAPEPALAERFATLHERLKQLLDSAARVSEQEALLRELLVQARDAEQPEQRDAILEQLPDWPADVPAPSLLGELLAMLDAGRDSAKDAAGEPATPGQQAPRNEDAHRVLGALRRELGKRNLRHANRLWHKALGLLEETPDPTARTRMEKLKPELDELQDWHAFAAEPKKEALCERMEALADEDMDAAEKATAIQALHEAWRDLMSSDQERDQTLWDRFKAASDVAYEPCREHFRELDREKEENLAKREALCRQLETFVESQDWDNADWPAVWEIRQKAPQEWKSYQPVRFTDARDIQRRFSALLERIDEQLRGATDRHRPERDRLLRELEALSDADDPEEAARQARDIQERWRRAGWVHPNVHRGMHRRLRRLSDQIFEGRNRQREERREAAEQDREAIEAALARLEPLFETSPDRLDLAAMQQEMDTLTALHCPPSAKATLRRLDQARDRFRGIRKHLPRWRQWQSLNERVQSAMTGADADGAQRQLAVALEVLAGVESPEQAREERMTWQLEKLPKAMTSGGNGDALEEAGRLMAEAEFEALNSDIRDRLIAAMAALEPKL